MARGVLPQASASRTGTGTTDPTPVTGDPTNNHQTTNDGNVVLRVQNTNAGSTARTLTVRVSKTIDGQAITSKTFVIPAAGVRWIGPFPTDTYGRQLLIDVDNAELKVTAFHFTPAG